MSRWVLLVIVLSGCASTPPIQEMSDARQSVRAAFDAGAARYFPTIMARLETRLIQAEKKLEITDYLGAAQQALAAKNEALRVRTLVLTLTSTMELVAQAERNASCDAHTRAMLRQALEAAARGEEALAMVLVDQVRYQTEAVLTSHDVSRF